MGRVVDILAKLVLGAAGAAAMIGAAGAADLSAPALEPSAPTMFDVAFGVAGVTDYRFRGVSNSSKDPVVQGYAELQALDWIYAGVWGSGVDFPSPWNAADASMEIDFYGGLRHTWDALTLDVGGLYYYYPGRKTAALGSDVDYWELYAKPTIALGAYGAISGNAYWTSDYFNSGSDALYLSVIPKFSVPVSLGPDIGLYVSAELGKQWINHKSNDLPLRWPFQDYVTWNIGGGVTYRAMTLDVRYSDTDLGRGACVLNTGARGRCGPAVVGKISFDTSLGALR